MGVIENRPALHELSELQKVIRKLPTSVRVEMLAEVRHRDLLFPLHGIVMGSSDRSAPTLGLFGGVHGLERIGSEVVIAWLNHLSEVLKWDKTLHERLERSRLVFMPLINPVGTYLRKRANGNDVDLMRNSPTVADPNPAFLLGGHRLSKLLPWYRGFVLKHEDMELEARAMCEFVMREVFPSRAAITVDLHSGFGVQDQLWFPYAKTRTPPPHLPEIMSMKALFDASYPNHFYLIEPQSKNYRTHGDLWDYLYDEHQLQFRDRIYIPWTLEMGSWLWLKKNPSQMFSSLGAFNPLKPHRLQRILRRHFSLFDFLHRAVVNHDAWAKPKAESRAYLEGEALGLWYAPE